MNDTSMIETLDTKLDRIDSNLLHLCVAIDALTANIDKIDAIQAEGAVIRHSIAEHGYRINTLEKSHREAHRNIKILQTLSIMIIITASAGAIIHLMN